MELEGIERSVIESVLSENKYYFSLGLTHKHFDAPEHREAFKAIGALLSSGVEADKASLASKIGAGAAASYAVAESHAEYSAEQLQERLRKRYLRSLLTDAAALLDGPTDSLVDFLATQTTKITSGGVRGLTQVSELTRATVERIEERRATHGPIGIDTGFDGLDKKLGGLRASEFVVIGARTSAGKTALAMNMALNMASAGVMVAYFSLEMDNAEMMDRITCWATNLDHQEIRKGRLDAAGFSSLGDGMARVHKMPLWLDERQGLEFEVLRNECRMFKHRGGQIVFIDYLTLLKYGDARMPRYERVGMLSAELKGLAKELHIPIVVLSQLNRASEHGETSLANIRQSGEVEENANIILLLKRERDSQEATVVVAKHRNGPTGEVPMRFDLQTLRFYSVEREER